MSATVKTNPLTGSLRAFSCVLGLAGLVAMVISSTMSSANTLYGLPKLIALAAVGIVLLALTFLVFPRMGKGDYLSTASGVAAVALFTSVIGTVINSRILLISGLFSYNAGNTVGWSVFYVTVASIVCFLLAILLVIVAAFMNPTKAA